MLELENYITDKLSIKVLLLENSVPTIITTQG